MPSFDFISDKRFRESLEADYNEMSGCVEQGAWKSAQVAAGSIVETLLVDYLQAHQYPNRPKNKDPLTITLSDAIALCASEGVLTQRTADLCSVIRSFRNLIHPGRVVRLNEPAPDRGSANIALQLVDLITRDLARELQKRVGLTAEQVLSKILRDEGSVKLLSHLLEGFNERQRERLLLDVLPASYRVQPPSDTLDFGGDDVAGRIRLAYRLIFDGAADETKKACLAEFVRIIKEEDGETVVRITSAFFRSEDLEYVMESQRPLVLAHVLGGIPHTHERLRSLNVINGLYAHLSTDQIIKWLDSLVRTVIGNGSPPVRSEASDQIWQSMAFSGADFAEGVKKRLSDWIKHFDERNQPEKSKILADIRENDIPF